MGGVESQATSPMMGKGVCNSEESQAAKMGIEQKGNLRHSDNSIISYKADLIKALSDICRNHCKYIDWKTTVLATFMPQLWRLEYGEDWGFGWQESRKGLAGVRLTYNGLDKPWPLG